MAFSIRLIITFFYHKYSGKIFRNIIYLIIYRGIFPVCQLFFANMSSPLMFQYIPHYYKQTVRLLPLLRNIPVSMTEY